MKRFHVHVAVADLEQSVGFYSTFFNAAPTVKKEDYANLEVLHVTQLSGRTMPLV